MNRYPIWIYIAVAISIVLGALYAVPNLYGEAPAVQVSSARATLKVDAGLMAQVENALKSANLTPTGVFLAANSIRVRLPDTDTQLRARDTLDRALNTDRNSPSFTVALNLLSNSPAWLTAIHALPMYLGLDLRGGVHFLLQVDMKAALTKRLDSLSGDIRSQLRDKNVRHNGITREGSGILVARSEEHTSELQSH